jgi:hypothetical protein
LCTLIGIFGVGVLRCRLCYRCSRACCTRAPPCPSESGDVDAVANVDKAAVRKKELLDVNDAKVKQTAQTVSAIMTEN